MESKCLNCENGTVKVNSCSTYCMCGGCFEDVTCEECNGNGTIELSEDDLFNIIARLVDTPSLEYIKEIKDKFDI